MYKDQIFTEAARAASVLSIPQKWLTDTIYLECGYNPYIVNGIGAVGLIQFVPSTAKGLGTTSEEIKKMTVPQQMDLTIKYLQNSFKTVGAPKDFISFYCHVFNPSWANKPNTAILPQKAYTGNRFLDLDHNGKITKAELLTSVTKRLNKGKLSGLMSTATSKGKQIATGLQNSIKNELDAGKPVKLLLLAGLGSAALFFLVRLVFRRKKQ